MWSKESQGGCGVRQRVEWVWSKAESQGGCGEAESQGGRGIRQRVRVGVE